MACATASLRTGTIGRDGGGRPTLSDWFHLNPHLENSQGCGTQIPKGGGEIVRSEQLDFEAGAVHFFALDGNGEGLGR
jgi:hypothetical protein